MKEYTVKRNWKKDWIVVTETGHVMGIFFEKGYAKLFAKMLNEMQ